METGTGTVEETGKFIYGSKDTRIYHNVQVT